MKPQVSIIYDSPGWSFHHIACQLQRHLSDEFAVTIMSHGEPDKEALLSADAVICLWYGTICYLHQGTEYFAPWQARVVSPECKMISCCFDEILRWDKSAGWANEETILFAIQHSDAFLCSSDGMARRMFPYFPQPQALGRCKDGVDLDLFPFSPYPPNPPKDLADRDVSLRVGWVGSTEKFGDLKGVEIIRSACKDLPGVRLITQDKKKHGLLAHEDMHEFYEAIDVQVCMSSCEGTPNPILEASACGRAWISTDVGIVPEMMADALDLGCHAPPGIIIPRQESALRECLRKLSTNRQHLPVMGKVGRYVIEKRWQWGDRAEQYRDALHAAGVWGDSDLSIVVHRPPKDTPLPNETPQPHPERGPCTVTLWPEDDKISASRALSLLQKSKIPFALKVIVSKANLQKIPQYIELADEFDCDIFFQEVLPDGDKEAFLSRALLVDHVENEMWIKNFHCHPCADRVRSWPLLMRRCDIERAMGGAV